jgi:hypothetical protein
LGALKTPGARCLQFVLILSAAFANAQTVVRPEQIINVNQVRICTTCDPRPGTLLVAAGSAAAQIQDGRYITTPQPGFFSDPADNGKPTVCLITFYRITIATWPGRNVRSSVCFTQFGLAQLLMDNSWMAWWTAHTSAPPPPASTSGDPVAVGPTVIIALSFR